MASRPARPWLSGLPRGIAVHGARWCGGRGQGAVARDGPALGTSGVPRAPLRRAAMHFSAGRNAVSTRQSSASSPDLHTEALDTLLKPWWNLALRPAGGAAPARAGRRRARAACRACGCAAWPGAPARPAAARTAAGRGGPAAPAPRPARPAGWWPPARARLRGGRRRFRVIGLESDQRRVQRGRPVGGRQHEHACAAGRAEAA
jgi:hypothetical protein